MERLDFIFKKERDFGALISDYIDLFKKVFKHFNKSIITVAFPFMAIMMLFGFFSVNYITDLIQNDFLESNILQTFAFLGLVSIVIFFVMILITTFGIEYMLLLEERGSTDFTSKDVMDRIKAHFKKYVLFFLGSIVLGLILSMPIGVVAMILAFIPLLGNIALGILMAMLMLFIYCALFMYLREEKELMHCYREAWSLVKKKIFIYGTAGYVMQFMVQIILMFILMIPTIILAIIAFATVGFTSDFFSSFGGKFIIAVGAGLMGLLFVFSSIYLIGFYVLQYFSLLESTHSEQTMDDIDSIGGDILIEE